MHDGLRMNHYVDLIRGKVKQIRRLDYLKALIKKCCGIDGDLSAHVPGGMHQCLLRRDRHQVFTFFTPKWSAGRG
ncbi:hypothetical protein SDC9_211480 [bioreactor metagenome]|uniref:Uncharacterized protein n=1 Tax=bioreactor metagenome TaxID=1076179 RepID=A0A645JJ62_9ZZZZ